MPSSFTPSNRDPESAPLGDELVRIDKAGFKGRFAKFKDRILDEFRWTLADLLEFQEWLGQEDYSYKGRKWKEVFASGAKIVGEDSTISTPLSADQPAGSISRIFAESLGLASSRNRPYLLQPTRQRPVPLDITVVRLGTRALSTIPPTHYFLGAGFVGS